MIWNVLAFLLIVGAISKIPVVGEPVAFTIVLAVIVGWIVRAFVRAARPRRRH